MRVFEPILITINPTSVCTAACRHCCMESGPDRTEQLTAEQLTTILLEIFQELPQLEVIVFSGGESTLLGETQLDAIRLCKEHGVMTRLVTNAYWARSLEQARTTLRELRDAGLDEVNFSTDDYHLPFISLQKVRYAFEAAMEMDFQSVVIASCYGPETWLTPNLLDLEFKSGPQGMRRRFQENGVPNELSPQPGETFVLLSNNPVSRIGRGRYRMQSSETTQAPIPLYQARPRGCWHALRRTSISSSGRYLACCGFNTEHNPILDYGVLGQEPLAVLLDRADDDLVSNMIALLGPPVIKEMLERWYPDEVDFPRDTYTSICEVCEDLTGIEQNRRALYAHQDDFARTVVAARRERAEALGRSRPEPALSVDHPPEPPGA